MVSQNFTISEYDHFVYFKRLDNGMFIILVLYFDYIIIAIKSMVDINRLKALLKLNLGVRTITLTKIANYTCKLHTKETEYGAEQNTNLY